MNVEDKIAIHELNYRYALHIDLHQTEEWVQLFTEVIDPLLLCATDGPIGDDDIRRMTDCAVDTFLVAYAPLPTSAQKIDSTAPR